MEVSTILVTIVKDGRNANAEMKLNNICLGDLFQAHDLLEKAINQNIPKRRQENKSNCISEEQNFIGDMIKEVLNSIRNGVKNEEKQPESKPETEPTEKVDSESENTDRDRDILSRINEQNAEQPKRGKRKTTK